MNLIAHNKRFLHLTTGAPVSAHDARLLRCSTLFKDIQSGGAIPKKSIVLEDFGEISLVTIGDTAFPCLERLLKCFNVKTRDLKECMGCHGKRLWYAKRKMKMVYEKSECIYIIKYVVMAIVLLHKVCIHTIFFLSVFSFTKIHDSQDSRGRGILSLKLLSITSTRFTDT